MGCVCQQHPCVSEHGDPRGEEATVWGELRLPSLLCIKAGNHGFCCCLFSPSHSLPSIKPIPETIARRKRMLSVPALGGLQMGVQVSGAALALGGHLHLSGLLHLRGSEAAQSPYMASSVP